MHRTYAWPLPHVCDVSHAWGAPPTYGDRSYSLMIAMTIEAITQMTIATCIQIQNRGISIPLL